MRQRAIYVNKSLAKHYNHRKKVSQSVCSCLSKDPGLLNLVDHLQQLLEQSLTCAYLVQDDKIVYVNQNLANLFGYTREEMLELNPFDFVHPDDKDRLREETRLRLQGITKQEFYSVRGIRKDKSVFYYETKASSISLCGKAAILGTLMDITSLVQANQMIRDNDMRYRQLMRYLPESIVVHDGDRLLYVNNAGMALFGFKDEEQMLSSSCYARIHPDYLDRSIRRVEEILKTDEPNEFVECKVIALDGRIIDTEVSSIRIHNFQGYEYVVQSVFRDITARKREEEALIKTEKLSIAGQMAAGIAHEIRNPLTSLKGFTQFLKSKTDKYHEYFDIMLTELDRINAIVQEFMALAKPQANHIKSHNLIHILQHVNTLLDTQANLNNVQLSTLIDDGQPYISCDENQLKQVFINILKNAMEAMPDGGEVTIQLDTQQPGLVIIQIADQGIGIPKEQLSKLGGPFFTTKSGGTGLGLMICYRIIQAHQGSMSITSIPNQGTTVTIQLPVITQ